MRIAVPGTGTVGMTIAEKLRELGHDVGSVLGWLEGDGRIADVSAHGELIFNCAAGKASLAALEQARGGAAGTLLILDAWSSGPGATGSPGRRRSSRSPPDSRASSA